MSGNNVLNPNDVLGLIILYGFVGAFAGVAFGRWLGLDDPSGWVIGFAFLFPFVAVCLDTHGGGAVVGAALFALLSFVPGALLGLIAGLCERTHGKDLLVTVVFCGGAFSFVGMFLGACHGPP